MLGHYLLVAVPSCPGCLNTFGKIMEKKQTKKKDELLSSLLDIGWGATKKHLALPWPFQANLRSAACMTCQEQDVSALGHGTRTMEFHVLRLLPLMKYFMIRCWDWGRMRENVRLLVTARFKGWVFSTAFLAEKVPVSIFPCGKAQVSLWQLCF